MSEFVLENTVPQETVIVIEGGPELSTTVNQEVQTVIGVPTEPVVIDLNSGARGEPGSAVLNGAAYPSAAIGSVGDIYIVTDGSVQSGFVFTKYAGEGWVQTGNIRGPAGGIDTVNGYTGPNVILNKNDIGLGFADNTSDVNKPVSAATQNALNLKLSKSETYWAGHHPEGRVLANAYLANDLGNLRLRGGTYTQSGPFTFNDANIDTLFDGTATTVNPGALSATPIVLEFNLPKTLSYGAALGIGFGAANWHAKTVRIEAFSEGAWVDVINTTTNTAEELYASIPGNAGIGTTKVRVTLNNATALRIAHIWGFNYNSDLWSQVIMPRKGGAFYGSISVPNGIINVPTPTAATDAANKSYVDSKISLTGNETITGNKTFSGLLTASAGISTTSIAMAGTLTNNGSAIELGKTDGSAAASYIDFHTSATVVDYDARILANVGNNVNGQASLEFRGGAFNFLLGTITGNGSGLTALNASNLSSGTVADARLSANVFTTNTVQTVTAASTFSGAATFTGAIIVPTPTLATHAATKGYVDTTVNNVISAAPGALDTLNELAAALGDDPNFATTMTNALAGKEPTIATGNASYFWRGDKTWAAPTPAQVGLSNVTNDAQVTIGTAQTVTGVKTFSSDTYVSRLRSSTSGIISQTNVTLGSAVGDAVITRQHIHEGNTNSFKLVDMVTRTSATTADWTTTAHYQGVAVDTSFTLSPLATSGSRLRTWIGRNPNTGTFTFGQEGDTFLTLSATGATLGTGVTLYGNGSGLTTLNGTNISSGTVADARLSTNVALLAGTQTFSGAKTFSALITASAGVTVTGTVTATTFSGSGASLTALNASNLSTGTVPQARSTQNVTRIEHGSTAGTARPTNSTYVEWVGSVLPTNMAQGDTWINTSTNGNTADNQPSGAVMASASSKTTAPTGWYWMEGQEILISGDTPLYNELTNNGTVFPYGANTNGSGAAGSTHFRLPNGTGKTIHHVSTAFTRRANNVNGTGSPFASLGTIGGGVDAILTTAQLPVHNHGVSDAGHAHSLYNRTWAWGAVNQWDADVYFNVGAQGGDPAAVSNLLESGSTHGSTVGAYSGITIQNTGSGHPHDVLQPFITLRWMIKR